MGRRSTPRGPPRRGRGAERVERDRGDAPAVVERERRQPVPLARRAAVDPHQAVGAVRGVRPVAQGLLPDHAPVRAVEPGQRRAVAREQVAAGVPDDPGVGESRPDPRLLGARQHVQATDRPVGVEHPERVVAEREVHGLARCRGGGGEPQGLAGARVEAQGALGRDGPDRAVGGEHHRRGRTAPVGSPQRDPAADGVRRRVDAHEPGRRGVRHPQLAGDRRHEQVLPGADRDARDDAPVRGIDADHVARDMIGDPHRAECGDDLVGVGRQVELGDDGRAGWAGLLAAEREHAGDDRDREDRHGERRGQLGRREPPARIPQPLGERGAMGLALRRVVQLRSEPGHEVLPHRRGPILSLTAASPRLTRLRTTVSEVFSDAAISP